MARLEGAYDQINFGLGNLEGEVRTLRTELNSRLDGLGSRMDRLFLVVFGGVAGSIVATIIARVV
jgi:hypothetical protein